LKQDLMSDYRNINHDYAADSRSEVKSEAGGAAKADYGGELAKDTGVDLNANACTDTAIRKEAKDDDVGVDLNDKE